MPASHASSPAKSSAAYEIAEPQYSANLEVKQNSSADPQLGTGGHPMGPYFHHLAIILEQFVWSNLHINLAL